MCTIADMAKKKIHGEKKSVSQTRTKPNRAGAPRNFWFPAELNDAIEEYLSSLKPSPTATAAVILALQEFLEERGFWPPDKER